MRTKFLLFVLCILPLYMYAQTSTTCPSADGHTYEILLYVGMQEDIESHKQQQSKPKAPSIPILITQTGRELYFNGYTFSNIVVYEYDEETNEEGMLMLSNNITSDYYELPVTLLSGTYKILLLLDGVEWSGIIYL